MTRSDWFLFIFTFVVGMSAGMYLYIISFKPLYIPDLIAREDAQAAEFNVTGKSYGGMRDDYVHPSFRIAYDGSYSYLPGGMYSEVTAPVEGRLPRRLFHNLKREVSKTNLSAVSESGQKDMCNIFVDGNDHLYRITQNNATYEIDTCRSMVSYDAPLLSVLDEVWTYLHDPTAYDEDPLSLRMLFEEYFADQPHLPLTNDPDISPPVACTMDAKICPDGSAVGRVGPNCEFAACPLE